MTVATQTTHQMTTTPLTPETLVFGFTAASNPRVSPDGTTIVYALGKTDAETAKAQSQLWRCDIDGGNVLQLTFGGTQSGAAVWSADGSRIAFTSDRVEKPAKQGIFVLPIAGGEGQEVTRHAVGISGLAWSPDGAHLAYVASFDPANPDEAERPADAPPPVRVFRRIDYKQDNRGYLGDNRLQLWVVDVASGTRRMLTQEPVDHTDPVWSPDGKTISVKIPNRNGMCSQLGLIDVTTGAVTLVGPVDGSVSQWVYTPDGAKILYAGDETQTWQSDFFLYDRAAGTTRRLTDDLAVLPDAGFPTISSPSQPVWLPDGRALIHAARAGGSGLYALNIETSELETLKTWEAVLGGLSADATVRYVVQGFTSLERAGEIVVTDLTTNTATVITAYSAPTLTASPAAAWERFDIERGGLTIEAWLLFPPGFEPGKRYPVILDVHGGPNGHYGYGFNASQQALAAAAFLVVYSNPRGSSSYGRDFTQRVVHDWGGEDFLDLMGVVDAVLERPYADAARTGIYGYSYGGYMTAWTIGQTDRFAAAVCGAPCFDLESMWGTSDIGHTFGRLQWGGSAHDAPEWYAAHSPSYFAHRAVTPTLIVHGEADDRCPIGQGEQMFVALTEAGCEVEFARYPGGSHLFLRSGPPAHKVDYYTRVTAWFRDHLGGAV